jgi:hypothetical protein
VLATETLGVVGAGTLHRLHVECHYNCTSQNLMDTNANDDNLTYGQTQTGLVKLKMSHEQPKGDTMTW